jgi:tight adherence protein C
VSAVLAAAAGGLAGAGMAYLMADAAGAFALRQRAAVKLPRATSATLRAVVMRLSPAVLVGALTGTARGGANGTANGTAGGTVARLEAAGLGGRLGPREWAGLKVCAAVLGCALAAGVAGTLPGRLQVLALAAAPLAGFAAPDFWLGRTTARRLREAEAELPPMLDLLEVAVRAGAAPAAALGAVGARFRGPLAAEWRAAATAIALGTAHDEALGGMVRRLPAPPVRAFADCMRRARRRGLPLAEMLASQAAGARHEEQVRIRERAARAGPKIQLVVAFVLVPAMMLIVAAALIAELTAPGIALTY